MQMKTIPPTNDFFEEMKILPKYTNIPVTSAKLLSEMKLGLEGKTSSLPMIPSFIGDSAQIVPGSCVAAIDAGGTNLRISKIQFMADCSPIIQSMEKYPMPGSLTPVTSDEFFDFIASHLADILPETDRIGFCFSYEVEVQPSQDGKIISLGKEVIVKGCEGKLIGEELKKALARQGLPSFSHITVLNDTTAALLGGKLLYQNQNYSHVISFILGTGTNTCYYEANRNIKKSPDLYKKSAGRTIVNLESGNFDNLDAGPLDEEFWAETNIPEIHHLEKLSSGQYLGALLLKYLKAAAQRKLFSAEACASVLELESLETRNITEFLASPDSGSKLAVINNFSSCDSQILLEMIHLILDRSARLVVSCLFACIEKIQAGKDSDSPVLIIAEGSTYSRCPLLKEKIKYYLLEEVQRELKVHIQIQEVENAVIYGTAFSAL